VTVLARFRNVFRRKQLTEGQVRMLEAQSAANDQILDKAVEVRRPTLRLPDPEDESQTRDTWD
jgi:hypothetical protein